MQASDVVDPRLEGRLLTSLLPFVYVLLLVATGLGAIAAVAIAFAYAWWLGLVALVVVPVVTAGLVAAVRIGCELVLLVSNIAEDTRRMAAGLKRVEATVDGVAEDMPRIGFLRGSPRRTSA